MFGLIVDPCFLKVRQLNKGKQNQNTFINKATPPVACHFLPLSGAKCPIKCKMQHTQSCNLKTFHDNLLQIALDSSPQQWKTGPLFIHTVLAPQSEVTSKTIWIKSLQLCSAS